MIRLFKYLCPIILGALLLSAAHAQTDTDTNNQADQYWLNWKENEVKSFPNFDLKKAIEITELDKQSQLTWYIDPKTIEIGSDTVVRYALIAVSDTGTINAMYEGILCTKDQYKIYARAIGHTDDKNINWRKSSSDDWKELSDVQRNSHINRLASFYMCDGNATVVDVQTILYRVKNPYASQHYTPGKAGMSSH